MDYDDLDSALRSIEFDLDDLAYVSDLDSAHDLARDLSDSVAAMRRRLGAENKRADAADDAMLTLAGWFFHHYGYMPRDGEPEHIHEGRQMMWALRRAGGDTENLDDTPAYRLSRYQVSAR